MKDTSPYDTTRERGCLSTRDRDYLLGELEDVEAASQREREIRGVIRERLWNTLLDFVLIWEHAEDRDIEPIFSPSSLVEDSANAYREAGLESLLAIVYTYSTKNTVEPFEELLEKAIRTVEDQRSVPESTNFVRLTPPDVTLSVEYAESIDVRELEAKFEYLEQQDKWQSDLFSFQELLYLFWSVCRDETVDEDTQQLIIDNLASRVEGRWSLNEEFVDVAKQMTG